MFHYQPWIGQFKIESTVYDVGLQSSSGAWFPAKLYVLFNDMHTPYLVMHQKAAQESRVDSDILCTYTL